ncbi:MAG TPA: SRPBCC family protein [Candidatus Sulfotelmatobacter sp.]|nr:SRPBCC family protein [Candidatus Sulfotelmatobacter sp.]
MATLEFSAGVVAKVPPERAFDYFADYRHVADVLEGVSRWEPIGAKTRGAGARYEVEMSTLGFPLESVLRLNRWRRPREIGWVSERGLIKQEGGFTFTPVPDGVRIELRIAYEPPGGVIGAAVARRVDSVVRHRLEKALDRIRNVLEA